MMVKQLVLCFSLFFTLSLANWENNFKYNQCYDKEMEDRLPLSVDNLIAIVEEYEKEYPNTGYEDLASGILKRYRYSGVIFDPKATPALQWSTHQTDELDKQDVDDKILKHSVDLAEYNFEEKQECSLHMMVSHSTDTYPHAGVDYPWENNVYNRKKRSYKELEPERVSDHPIEFGVIQTPAGPVAGGLLLAGIMSEDKSAVSVGDVLDESKAEKVPKEMTQVKIDPLYGATISGELAQAAILTGRVADSDFEVGPIGRFGNCTACARIYVLGEENFSQLSRAEIFGGLDGLIIGSYLKRKSFGQKVTLSEILRMYYSNHGLFNSDIRACNRQTLFKTYLTKYKDKIREEALNYMYAYQQHFSDVSGIVEQKDTLEEITDLFEDYLDPVISEFTNFVSSYQYDDPGYERCPQLSNEDVRSETQVDLMVIYSPSSNSESTQKQREYIAQTARKIGVGYHRSRMAIFNGEREEFVYPMYNHPNIANFSCYYAVDIDHQGGSSKQDFEEVMDHLDAFYKDFYEKQEEESDRYGTYSQVVLWNLPSQLDGEDDDKIRVWNQFNLTYPDVTFIFAGMNDDMLDLFYKEEYDNEDELIFISNKPEDPDEIAEELTNAILKAPRMFYYPACNTLVEIYEDYNEGNHVYSTYVSPNFTTFIRIPPENFHFSENVKLTFSGSNNIRICASRTAKEPVKEEEDDVVICGDPLDEIEFEELCGRYVEECDSIYISVTGNPTTSNAGECQANDECQFPNQLEFEMTHEGMICGCSGIEVSFLSLAVMLLCILFINYD